MGRELLGDECNVSPSSIHSCLPPQTLSSSTPLLRSLLTPLPHCSLLLPAEPSPLTPPACLPLLTSVPPHSPPALPYPALASPCQNEKTSHCLCFVPKPKPIKRSFHMRRRESNNSGISKEHSTLIGSLRGALWSFSHINVCSQSSKSVGFKMQETAQGACKQQV